MAAALNSHAESFFILVVASDDDGGNDEVVGDGDVGRGGDGWAIGTGEDKQVGRSIIEDTSINYPQLDRHFSNASDNLSSAIN